MWSPLSATWEKAIRGSHVLDVRVDAYRAGVLVASDLPIDPESASISMDGTSEVRRSISLTVADPKMAPTLATSILTPHGTELRVESGFRIPDGTYDRIPVGRFRIDRPTTELFGAVQVTGVDYGRMLMEDTFLNPVQSIVTNTVIQEITRMIQLAQPGAAVTVASNASGITTLCKLLNWDQDSSRMEAVKELATSIGVDVAPNAAGTWVIRKLPEVTDTPVSFAVDIGENGVLVGGEETWDRENTYNGWTARGEPGDGTNPVQAFAYDSNAASPTYWGSGGTPGPFGRRNKVFSSALLTSVPQCQTVADTLLRRSIAGARAVKLQCIPNPALDYGDVINVKLPGPTEFDAPRDEKHMIRSFTLPLGLGLMELDLTAPKPS